MSDCKDLLKNGLFEQKQGYEKAQLLFYCHF